MAEEAWAVKEKVKVGEGVVKVKELKRQCL
jgi:hypothetical protein